jgi:hypothetical protein
MFREHPSLLSGEEATMDGDGVAVSATVSKSGADYDHWLERIQSRFVALGQVSLFMTDAKELWQAYLDGFMKEQRQSHDCSACRKFIRRYGGLVTLDERGLVESPFWHAHDAPPEYQRSVEAMRHQLRHATVTGVFVSLRETWGTPETGSWRHFGIVPPLVSLYRGLVLTAGQAIAEKREDYRNVMRALDEFSPATLAQALSLLKSDALYRSEKVLGPAQWLADLHTACDKANRANVVWRAVATAPAGFCHPRASMIGTLLEDIASGMEFGAVSRRFAEKMHPLR